MISYFYFYCYLLIYLFIIIIIIIIILHEIFTAWMEPWVAKFSMVNLTEFSGYLRWLLWMNSVENWKEFKWLYMRVRFNGVDGYSSWLKFKGNGEIED